MNTKEVWKDVKNYEGCYQVSNLGNVKSLNYQNCGYSKHLKQVVNNGYFTVNLSKLNKSKTHQTHRMVAIAFLNHTPCGYKIVVDHIDGNPLNNRLDNLQLITHRKNVIKGATTKNVTSKYVGVTWNKSRSKWQAQIRINGKQYYLGLFHCEIEASKAYSKRMTE